MNVSFFWRRASAEAVSSLAPHDLLELVPYWGEQQESWDTGLVTGVEFHCSVMHQVLIECSPTHADAAGLAVYGGEPRSDLWTNPDGEAEEVTVVTVLAPDEVASAAEALSGSQHAAWITANPQRMTAMVQELRFSTSWDDGWARRVAGDLQGLAHFYRTAASAGDAMIKYISC